MVTIRDIEETFANRKPEIIGNEQRKESAVSICLIQGVNEEPRIVFEVRSMNIGQPGDICLPGGRLDEGESACDAAIREICEELLVKPEQIEMIGEFGKLITGERLINVFVARLSDYAGTYNEDEVQEVFTVPVNFFRDSKPEVYRTEYRVIENPDFPYDRIVGGRKYNWKDRTDTVYFFKYERWDIWGLTAKIMNSFSRVLNGK